MRRKNEELKIGEKLKNARLSCGFTQEDVCDKLGYAPRYISQLENNESAGSIFLIIDLCNLYGITLDFLYADYLKVNSSFEDISSISGYFKLNDEHKSIIENNITFLNKLENN